ncbi:MAG: hypothetical protein ACQET8_17320 [Bacillota bacterium]
MNTLKDQLKKWKNKNQKVSAKKKKASQSLQKDYSEKLSDRDLKELMGMGKATYRRYRGAYRQR